MKDFMKEFRAFAARGNVIDLAFAVVVGTAFGNIVSSLVEDIIMPPIGFLIGGVNFSDLAITLATGISGAEPVTINYGTFIQALIDFFIIALVLFVLLKVITKLQTAKEAVPAGPSREVLLLTEIRDLLKK